MVKVDEINNIIKEAKDANVISTKEISDGHHTFGDLYKHRIILFCTLCNLLPDISFKSKKHFDEENDPMYNDSFIAGIHTPKGVVTYHIKLEYWGLFKVKELEKSPQYDGYTDDEVLNRLLSLIKKYK